MNDSNQIRTLLLNILRIGLLRIRALGIDGSAEQCNIEADHLHNLPGLVESLRPAELLYYYNIERVSFLRRTTLSADEFRPQWEELAKLIEAANPQLRAGVSGLFGGRLEPYEPILNEITPEVSFGYSTIHVYRPEELESGQLGYSVNPEGQSLIGDQDGDWRRTWLVIGYDEICGDPVFIDTSEEGYPVYTAIHGEGRWDPEPVAVSLKGFAEALSAVAAVAKGREYPVALEQNPLTPSERDVTLATIRQCNPNMDISFWENLLSEF